MQSEPYGDASLAAGNFTVLTGMPYNAPYLSAVAQLRVFLSSSYNWLYPLPVMVLDVRSRKANLLPIFSNFLIPPQGLVVKFKKKLVVNNP